MADARYDIPLLEDDLSEDPVLDPAILAPAWDEAPDAAVMCFFPGIADALGAQEGSTSPRNFGWSDFLNPFYVREHQGYRIGFYNPMVGAPRSLMFLEEAIAWGVERFIAFGSCGVLVPDLAMSHPLVVNSAIRDEGTSFHYVAPSRTIDADPMGVQACREALTAAGREFVDARAWTTDAIFRETRSRVERRVAEGAIVVEMEASALIACAQRRDVRLGQILFSGDSLAEEVWDERGFSSATDAQLDGMHVAMDAAARLCALDGVEPRG